jgi:ribonuclease J
LSLKSYFEQRKKNAVYVLPIGGCGTFGKNMTAYIHNDQYILVDCGVMFAQPEKLGVDAIISNIEFLVEALGLPQALLITHGHEDHIGGLCPFISRYPTKLYGTPWCEQIFLERKASYQTSISVDMQVIHPGQSIVVGDFEVEWIHVNHSIPFCCSLGISVGDYKVVHTSDFKIDKSTQFEAPIDLETFAKYSGADLLVTDSTNSEQEGRTPSEDSVFEPIKEIAEKTKGRCYVTTFASNVWRILVVLKVAKSLNRDVFVSGGGFLRSLRFAQNLNLVPQELLNVIINLDSPIEKIPGNAIVLASGSQGESLASMAKIIRGEHRQLKLRQEDCIIFSSRLIPGNERSVFHMYSLCAKQGITIYDGKRHPGVHVSGHAYQDDLIELLTTVSAKNYLAVHGTFSQLRANQNLAVGHMELAEDGDLFRLDKQGFKKIAQSDVDWLFIDRNSQDVMSRQVLKERLSIGESGAAFVSLVLSDNRVVDFECQLVGLNHKHNDKKLFNHVKAVVEKSREDVKDLKEALRVQVRKFFEVLYRKKIVVRVTTHHL